MACILSLIRLFHGPFTDPDGSTGEHGPFIDPNG